MSYSVVPTVADGDIWTASEHNTYIKNNLAAIWKGSAAGDMDYYSGSADKVRLPIGTALQLLRVNAGATAPEWSDPAVLELIHRRQGGNATNWAVQGSGNYTPASAMIQCGVARVAVSGGNGFVVVTFPVAFSGTPVVLITKPFDGVANYDFGISSVGTTSFRIDYAYPSGSLNVDTSWIAIGPP